MRDLRFSQDESPRWWLAKHGSSAMLDRIAVPGDLGQVKWLHAWYHDRFKQQKAKGLRQTQFFRRWSAGIDYELATADRFLHHAKVRSLREANMYLGSLRDTLRRADLDLAADDDDLREWAKQKAKRCALTCTDERKGRDQRLDECRALAARYGFKLHQIDQIDAVRKLLQELDGPGTEEAREQLEDELADLIRSALARAQCDKWWRRRVLKESLREVENLAVAMREVNRHSMCYVSDYTLQKVQSRKQRSQRLLEKMLAVNEAGQEYSLAQLAELGTSNPYIRRSELMVRINGFEQCARWLGHVGMFYTFTCPSEFHSNSSKYIGATPREAQEYLCDMTARMRAAIGRMAEWADQPVEPPRLRLQITPLGPRQPRKRLREAVAGLAPVERNPLYRRAQEGLGIAVRRWHEEREQFSRYTAALEALRGVRLYGFRVAEPHNDACPHWHMLVFMPPEAEPYITLLMYRYALEHSPFEDGAAAKRFTAKQIDHRRGTAAGYIAKYIAKNIDGVNMGDDLFSEYDIDAQDGVINGKAEDNAPRVLAWASCHRFRQFQQLGGAPVGPWREGRRIARDLEELEEVEGDHCAHVRRWRLLRPENFTLEAPEYVEAVARAADASDWAAYSIVMGGVMCKRKDMRLRVARWEQFDPETGETTCPVNEYGDRLEGNTMGLVCDGARYFKTRAHTWEIGRATTPDPNAEKVRASILEGAQFNAFMDELRRKEQQPPPQQLPDLIPWQALRWEKKQGIYVDREVWRGGSRASLESCQ